MDSISFIPCSEVFHLVKRAKVKNSIFFFTRIPWLQIIIFHFNQSVVMKKILLFLFLLSTPLFSQEELKLFEERKKEAQWCFNQHEQTLEGKLSFLYLTSTLSTPFSNELLLLNASLFNQFTDVINLKTQAVDPEYNPSFQVDLSYHIPSSNHILTGTYRYIHNDADGSLKRDVLDTAPDGMVQRNIQNDRGNQHVHLHTVDLLLRHLYHVTKNAAFYICSGLSFNDFHYSFSFHDIDQIFNSQVASITTPTSTQLELKGNRHIRIWGLGPKLLIGFEYNFLPFNWPHDLNLDVGFEFSMLYSKKWGRGRFRGQGTQTGAISSATNFSRYWEDKPEFALLPNLNLGLSLQYRYCTRQNVILGLTVGYRVITFWEIYDLNREISYRMEQTQPVLAAQLREEDSVGFSGPYLSFGIAY